MIERLFATAFSAPMMSRAVGRLADARPPGVLLRAAIRAYSQVYGVDWSEVAEPIEAFPTFGAFFVRRLREGARVVDPDPGAVVSPCDARLSSMQPVPPSGRLEQIKGRDYSIEALLGSVEDAAPYRDGLQATLYLSPAMYHRVHAPVGGVVRGWRYIPGRLFPVNGPAVRSIDGLFTRNERVIVHLDSPTHGRVAVVLVGATNVGRITLCFTDLVTNVGRPAVRVEPRSPIPLGRGDELGAFNLGSTVVLLMADASLRAAGAAVKGLVRMGEALWRKS